MTSYSAPSTAIAIDIRWAALAGAAFAILWFVTLGQRSLITPDEGRYATIALHMATSGDWVTPRLNGFLYFEKPPLQYWIGAMAFELFGVNEFSARLWPGLAGFLTVLAVGFSATRLWGRRVGLHALAIAGSSLWIVANSHFLTLDAGLTLFLTLCLAAVLLAQQPGLSAEARRRWIWLAWAAMAGATLSKGLIGILIPGTVLVIYSAWQRDLSVWRLQWLSGLAIFFALAAPWFVLVERRNPGFAQFFFIHEHFARYLTTEHHREGAWWYFVPYLLIGLLPWTSALPWLLRGTGPMDKRPRALLLAWSIFIFVFFSISGSKLPSYILPMFPALAMLIALAIERSSARALRRHLWLPAAIWLLLGAVATQSQRFADGGTPAAIVIAMGEGVLQAAIVFLVAAGLAAWLLGRERVTAAVLCVAGGHAIAVLLLMNAHDHYGQLRSSVGIAPVLESTLPPGAPVFSLRGYDQTLPFYLRRDVILVDYVDEFAYGEAHEPGRIVPSLEAFSERWRALPAAGATMDVDTYNTLLKQGLPMTTVFQDVRRVVVIKP